MTRRPPAEEEPQEEPVRLKDSEGTVRIGKFRAVVDDIIQEAQAKGAFDDLPGKGKPLDLSDDSCGQDDWLVNHILMQNNVVPEWIELDKQIRAGLDWLKAHADHPERAIRLAEVNGKIDRLNLMAPSLALQRPRAR